MRLKYRNPVSPANKMTYILGAKCSDGVVLVADRKITYDDYTCKYEDKLFMHHPAPIVWCSAGSTNLSQKFKEQSYAAAQKYKDAIDWLSYRDSLEDITKSLNTLDPTKYELEVFVAGQVEDPDGVKFAMLYNIDINGKAHIVKENKAIGRGEPYGSIFLKKCWRNEMSMQDVAELGYFIIRIIEVNELNLTVGLEKNGHPQIYYTPNQGKVEEANEEKLQAIRKKVDEWLSSYDSQIKNLFV